MDKHIVAGSAGSATGFNAELELSPTLLYTLSLTHNKRPRLAYIDTAMGDDPFRISRFYDACSREDIIASHLALFPMPNHADIEQFILSQDVIWVGGGSFANMLAVWQLHGLDLILQKAYEQGIVLAGVSAGALCWSSGGTTDSFGTELRLVKNGLGLVPYSCGVHYDNEVTRRPLFQKLIAEKKLPEGYATDDGVSIHFINGKIAKAVSEQPDKRAYHVYLTKDGLQEDVLDPHLI